MLPIHKQYLAEQDLIALWCHSYEQWGEQQADRYFNRIAQAIETISEHPEIGVVCDYQRTGYRKYTVQEHCIFYRLTDDVISIVRVLGKEMDYGQHLDSISN